MAVGSWTGGPDGAMTSSAGWIAGLAIFFVPFALRGLGGGDVKLLAALGAWVGPTDVIWVALYTGIAGGLLALAIALANGYLRTALRQHWAADRALAGGGRDRHARVDAGAKRRPQTGIRTAHPVRNCGDDMAALTRFRKLSGERGSQIIEAALVLPLLLLVVLGILDFGMLFWRYESVTNAAREGARVAILPGYSTTDVENRVEQYLTDAGLAADAGHDGRGSGRRGRRRRHLHHDDGRHGVVSARLSFLVGALVGYFGGTSLTSTSLNATSMMRYEGGALACP